MDQAVGDEPQTGAARIGAELREVRERLGWKLSDVAAGLRIRLPYLEAIESGELSALPGPAYQTGFVRTYARSLGLDAEEILRRFRAAGLGANPRAELSFLAPVPDRAVPTGAIILLGVFLLLAGYGLWYWHTARERHLAAEVPSVPAELAPLAIPKQPPAPVAKPVTAAPVGATAPAVPAAQVPAAQVPAATTQAAVPAVGGGQVIATSGDSWVEVRDSTGNILFSRVLHAGETWPVPNMAGLTMTAGNAAATSITTNGKPGAPLGTAGTVVHGYQLTPAATPAAPPPAAKP